jgi:hypothetical protein
MQILTGLENDHCHRLDSAGAYEWWYADALDPTGEWGVVMILFRGMPMSPDYLARPESMHGGYALSVYHHGVRIAFAFGGHSLTSCSFSEQDPEVHMPGAKLSMEGANLVMSIDAPCGGDGRRAAVRMEMAVRPKVQAESEQMHADHAWVLAGARSPSTVHLQISEVHGIVVEREFSAISYHDHNMGQRAMSRDFGDWYWGRFHAERLTYVFLVTRRSVDTVEWFGRVHDDGRVEALRNVQLKLRRRRYSILGLMFHRELELTGTDASGNVVKAVCRNGQVCEDGPFYQRYVSHWSIDGDATGLGMSEYMDVRRLSQAWIRPFLRLPWVVSS